MAVTVVEMHSAYVQMDLQAQAVSRLSVLIVAAVTGRVMQKNLNAIAMQDTMDLYAK